QFCDMVIFGCPDDTGVRLNRGRPGASKGPDSIRSMFYKMALPLDPKFGEVMKIYDAGNIDTFDDIIKTHKEAYMMASSIVSKSATVVALGGGHDFAAPNILGWIDGRDRNIPKARNRSETFGVLNIDPHLDVRELENDRPHSGTPFRQVVQSGKVSGHCLVQFGAREGRNARSHFAFCKENKVQIHTFEELMSSGNLPNNFKSVLTKLASRTSEIAVTLDIDSCCDLEGASAAPVIGFTAWDLCQFAYSAGQNSKVTYFEIAEVAPDLDPTLRSSRVAGEILYFFMKGRLKLAQSTRES
ncbi:MAG: formimidoylglutamase, partial [Proteobacteria bacterium]|nr:formimidoylglutamase [Pseudomonadota bacterium]